MKIGKGVHRKNVWRMDFLPQNLDLVGREARTTKKVLSGVVKLNGEGRQIGIGAKAEGRNTNARKR